MSFESRLKRLEAYIKPKPTMIFTFNRDECDEEAENTIYIYFALDD